MKKYEHHDDFVRPSINNVCQSEYTIKSSFCEIRIREASNSNKNQKEYEYTIINPIRNRTWRFTSNKNLYKMLTEIDDDFENRSKEIVYSVFNPVFDELTDLNFFDDCTPTSEAYSRILESVLEAYRTGGFQEITLGVDRPLLEQKPFEVKWKKEDQTIIMDPWDLRTKIRRYKNIKAPNNEKFVDDLSIEERPLLRCVFKKGGRLIESVEDGIESLILEIAYMVSSTKIESRYIVTDTENLPNDLQKIGKLIERGDLGKATLTYLIDEMLRRGWIKYKKGYTKPGFYYNDERIISEFIETKTSKKDLIEALLTLEDFLGSISEKIRSKAVYIFKHQLTAPFNYARKQMNIENITSILLTGESQTGKTTIANATTLLYKITKNYIKILNMSQQDFLIVHGKNVGTEARYAYHLRKTTLPIVIDEGEDLFEQTTLLNMTKQAIDNITARTTIGRDGITSYESRAYTTPVYTMNEEPTTIRTYQGLARRLKIVEFEDIERIPEKEKRDFQERWKVSDRGRYKKDSPLRGIWHIGAWTYKIIKEDPRILEKDNIETANEILRKLHQIAGLEYEDSVWALYDDYKPKTIQEMKEDENMLVIDYLREKMSQGWDRKRVGVEYDEYGGEKYEKVLTIEEKAEKIAKGQIYPWFAYNENQNAYILTKTYLDELKKNTGVRRTLKSLTRDLTELTGDRRIEYKPMRLAGHKKITRGCLIPKETFEKLISLKEEQTGDKKEKGDE